MSDDLTKEEIAEERAKYTWEMFNKDLALFTHLTLNEAFDISYPLREISNPYDLFPPMMKFVSYLHTGNTRAAGEFLKKIVSYEYKDKP